MDKVVLRLPLLFNILSSEPSASVSLWLVLFTAVGDVLSVLRDKGELMELFLDYSLIYCLRCYMDEVFLRLHLLFNILSSKPSASVSLMAPPLCCCRRCVKCIM